MSAKKTESGPRIVVIPDVQVKSGVPTVHLEWAANYIADKKPDICVQLGDFADMPSLSSYDRGRKSAENRRYQEDVESVHNALSLFDSTLSKRKCKLTRKVMTLGNHEDRITRATEEDARLDGKLSIDDLRYKEHGWEVYPFLQPVNIHNIMFCHYFPVSANGRVTQTKSGCPNARVQGQRVQKNCVAGHMQGLDTAVITTPFGMLRSIICGSYYMHEENYLSPVGQMHWKGILLLNDVRKDGYFDLAECSLDFLERKYG